VVRAVSAKPPCLHDESGPVIHNCEQVQFAQVPKYVPALEIKLPHVVGKVALKFDVIFPVRYLFSAKTLIPEHSSYGLE